MKLFRIVHHQRKSFPEDLLLNSKEHSNIKDGDIVEIYHPESNTEEGERHQQKCRLLLQASFSKDPRNTERDFISVEASIACAFNLKIYGDVCMKVVEPSTVALDSVEFTFKDQYLGRSEMWRLKKYLTNTCVYVNKIIEYCGSIRCQVYEMWSMGEKVACGVIDKNTKIVYRSSTSMVYLFIQMSSEMWDFDIHGDLYFEKAVNGFLTELFAKWKKQGSNHEVTIVLFSRTFYEAKSLEEFPVEMQECLQMDYRGRFYEDFYRVAIQNERNDDWCTILVQLRRIFTAYKDLVLKYHERPDNSKKMPKAYNSSAAQGNFLEVLNISLNVFEKHYLDRSFDRTGQLSVVITPGVGVFEVDRELTNITKQRIIDNGVASDLVCVGEQPLHAVPLLQFHYKDVTLRTVDDYCFPHWINLSFYSSNKKVAYSTFIPRIKLPPFIERNKFQDVVSQRVSDKEITYYDDSNTEYIHNSLFDYDAYDEKVFGHDGRTGQFRRTKKSSVPSLDVKMTTIQRGTHRRKMSDPDVHHLRTSSNEKMENSLDSSIQMIEKSHSDSVAPLERALINPFDPSNITVKLTSNRRRWSHIFPKTKTGNLIQQHHYQIPVNNNTNSTIIYNPDDSFNVDDYENSKFSQGYEINRKTKNSIDLSNMSITPSDRGSFFKNYMKQMKKVEKSSNSTPSKSLLWGATGEQEWSASTKTGVDWKSLTIPACLPITTDYFPDKRSLNNDYVLSIYTLLPDDVNADFMRHRAVQRRPLDHSQVFNELVSQRLAQGFQLIILPDEQQYSIVGSGNSIQNKSLLNASLLDIPKIKLLSIGRIFHKITLTGSEIKVTRYRPRHPYSPINVEYRYRFHAPQHTSYEVSGVIFTTEKLENFNWNLMDQYICTRGDTDFMLHEQMKYWRYRMYLLPKDDKSTKRIMEENLENCDIYNHDRSPQFFKNQVDDFVKYVENYINKIKRVRNSKASPTTQSSHLTRRRHSTSTSINSRSHANSQNLNSSPFRERLGSNRYPERQRPSSNHVQMQNRSGSKIETKSQLMALQASLAEKNAATKGENEDNDDCFVSEPAKFTSQSTIEEIFEAFKHPSTGVGFLESLPSLPSMSFTSYDAYLWLSNRTDNSVNSWDILKEMHIKKMICHASGEFSFPIKSGYYLYYIVQQNFESIEYKKPLGDLEAFEYEWVEVEIPPKFILSNADIQKAQENDLKESNVPSFLKDEFEKRNIDGTLYKQAHLEVDTLNKSDRVEWGHARYNREMIPGTAFEITVQWITASGPIVQELVKRWDTKAQACGFQLISIPADPLAEPFIEKSDPLRSPIFIPLNIKSLLSRKSHLFEDFSKETWDERMIFFQDEIVRRFGFIPRSCETKTGSNDICADYHYVHITGNMFVLVPRTPHAMRVALRRYGKNSSGQSSLSGSLGTQKRLKNYYHSEGSTPSKENQYISRHVQINNDYSENRQALTNSEIGFLWQWNHAIANRKWKSYNINGSDELYQHRMLRDFKDFCSNSNGRLLKFLEDSWEKKELQSLANT